LLSVEQTYCMCCILQAELFCGRGGCGTEVH